MKICLALVMLWVPLGAAGIELLEPDLVGQIEALERAVDRRFRRATDGGATAISATRGIYLPGYGVVFSIEVNLEPAANLSPFRRSYTADEIQQFNVRKRDGLEPLRRTMRMALVDLGPRLTELAPDLQVALAVSLFHFPWEDRTELPSQIVIAAARGALSGETRLTTRYY